MTGRSTGHQERSGAARTLAVVPARIASQRLPRKMLLDGGRRDFLDEEERDEGG